MKKGPPTNGVVIPNISMIAMIQIQLNSRLPTAERFVADLDILRPAESTIRSTLDKLSSISPGASAEKDNECHSDISYLRITV